MYEIMAAFLAGIASFFTPCILPIVPGFISSMAGTVHAEQIQRTRKVMFLSTGYFVLGFALIFALIGTIIACFCTSNSAIGIQLKQIIAWSGGIVMIALGIFMILSFKIPKLNFQKSIGLGKINSTFHTAYITSFVFGMTFAAGWTPCVGPILAAVLTEAVAQPAIAYNELLLYALGLGLPFLVISLFLSDFTKLLKHIVKYTRYFDLTMASVLIIIGIIFLLNQVYNFY